MQEKVTTTTDDTMMRLISLIKRLNQENAEWVIIFVSGMIANEMINRQASST